MVRVGEPSVHASAIELERCHAQDLQILWEIRLPEEDIPGLTSWYVSCGPNLALSQGHYFSSTLNRICMMINLGSTNVVPDSEAPAPVSVRSSTHSVP